MTPGRRAALLTAGFYASVFAASGAQLPYWPVWLADWGLTEAEIGRYLGLAILARIAGATLLSSLADRFAIRRWTIAGAALAAAGVYAAHLGIASPGALLLATLCASFCMAPLVPLGEALGLRAATWHGFAYAPVRAAGSVAFLAVNVAAGAAIGAFGAGSVLWFVLAGLLATAAFGALHPGGGAARSGPDRAGPGEVRRLVAAPAFLVAAAAFAASQASHSVYYVYSVLDWRGQGIDPGLIGALWAFAVIVETGLMLGPGRRWVVRLGPAGALALAGAAGVGRWGLMTLSPPVAALWPLQALHALTFAVGHLGAMAFLASAVPPRLAGSAQGVAVGLIGGLTMAATAFGAAAIVEAAGIAAAYWLSAALSGVGLSLAIVLRRLWRGGVIGGTDGPQRP